MFMDDLGIFNADLITQPPINILDWIEFTTIEGEEQMSRKDYEAIADALCAVKPEPTSQTDSVGQCELTVWFNCVNYIAAALQRDNNRFNPDRFFNRCKGE